MSKIPLSTTHPAAAVVPEAGPLLFHVEHLQERLHEVADLSSQSERLAALGTMAAAIAHEINNILTPVKAYAELALSSPGETGLVIKALERAAHGVDRATRISEMILECSRTRPTAARADVAEAARRAEAALPPDPCGKLRIEHRLADGLAAAIDPIALEQVLLNLFLNARKAMPRGGTVTVSGWASSTSIEVRVSDNGPGVPADCLKSVFSSFVTYSGASGGSTGLGLPICRRLVSEAGGTIDLESVVGKGTTVKLVLPLIGAARRASA
jgi:signal transduction histidine kinase